MTVGRSVLGSANSTKGLSANLHKQLVLCAGSLPLIFCVWFGFGQLLLEELLEIACFIGILRKDLVKKRSSTVQAGSASTLGNSATELLIVEIVVMKTSAGTSHKNIKDCVNPSQLLFTQIYQ